ncbi:MAG: ABC transporter permease [bacterium]
MLTLQVTTPALRYPNGTSVNRFLDPALSAMSRIHGVEAAGAISSVPYLKWWNNSNIQYEGVPGNEPTRLPIVEQRTASPQFFAVTKQRIISGRLFGAGDVDRPDAPAVVVVNQALAKRDFKGGDPVGRRFHTSDTSFATIIGVVSDIRNNGPIAEPAPEMYWPYSASGRSSSNYPIMIRVTGSNPEAVVAEVRSAIRAVDPTAAIASVASMPDVIAKNLGRPRFYFSLLGTFAAVAILLAVAGLYGVLSYAVAQRSREIGIRAALGSTGTRLVQLVAFEGLRLVAAGVVIGLLGGFAVTRLMVFMLYGVSPLDGVTWATSTAILVAAGIVAALVPARRASRVTRGSRDRHANGVGRSHVCSGGRFCFSRDGGAIETDLRPVVNSVEGMFTSPYRYNPYRPTPPTHHQTALASLRVAAGRIRLTSTWHSEICGCELARGATEMKTPTTPH